MAATQRLLDAPTTPDAARDAVRPHGTYVSWSRIESYLTCGRKYQLRYIESVPQQPSGALIGGSAIHDAIAAAHTNGWWDDAELTEAWTFYRQVFERMVEEAGGADAVKWGGRKDRQGNPGEGFDWWRGAPALLMLKQARAQALEDRAAGLTPLRGANGQSDGTEIRFRTMTPGGLRFLAYSDRVQVDADGRLVIDDYKTGKVGGSAKLQLAFYAWAARHDLGMDTARARFIYLRGDAKTRVQELDVGAFEPLVEPMIEDFEHGTAAGLFPIKPSLMCSSCDVAQFCEYGAALLGIPRAIPGASTDDWKPFDEEEATT